MSKKKMVALTAIPLSIIILCGIWLQYTHVGRVIGLYSFAAISTPFQVKVACAKDTNLRVSDKFEQPLNFDENSKNALREYWHFSYYRECLYKQGYDFNGEPIKPTELMRTSSGYTYTNHWAGISLTTSSETSIVYDNITNPDLDDYIIVSQILIGGTPIMVQYDRSYKVADAEALLPIFAGFNSKEGFNSPLLKQVTSPRPDVLAFEDGDFFGYVVIIPNSHIVTLYVQSSEARPAIEAVIASLTVL
jgi:hypothetical protein